MMAPGIAFSARKRGNCPDCLEYVLSKLEKQGLKTKTVSVYHYEMKSCRR